MDNLIMAESTTGTLQPNFLPLTERCSGDALIEMTEIVKSFKNAAGEFIALKGVTACFYPGEFVSVVGKSGSGKSTLVNMITGIDHPTSGSVRVGEAYVHNLNESDRSIWRGKNLGIVFQFFQLLPTLTLLENVMLPMYLGGHYSPLEREARALSLLDRVGLASMEYKLPAAVSGGQQQCAAIARALANDPPILIADEPTGNLDERTADDVFDLFAGLIDQGKTILMVTHDISLAQRTTRTLLLSDGELINPWVASTLPKLGHNQMLWLTHHLKARVYVPGETVTPQPTGKDWLVFVTDGRLDVCDSSGLTIGSIPAGSVLYSMNLPAGLSLIANPVLPVELLWVGGAEFRSWLERTPEMRSSLQVDLNTVLASDGQGVMA
jgi:putative ABC transport system ATP-binding protein